MSDDELILNLRATFPTLDKWRDALNPRLVPAPGSDLAIDDETWPYLPASTLASVAVGSCREHLHAVRVLFEAGELFPAATPTLCRSAMVGACLAVWMLEPDDRGERLRRSLSMAAEDYKRHLQFGHLTKTLLPPGQIDPSIDVGLDRLELRRGQILDELDNVGGLIEINLSDDVIPNAMKFAVPVESQRQQMVLRWRSGSAAAHVLVWHYYGNDGVSASELDAGNVGWITIGGDIGRLIMDYFPAYHAATAAWRLLDKRCRSSET